MTAWQVADIIFGGSSVILADEAFSQMMAAGWTFLEYNENGEDVWQPPNQNIKSGEKL
jgi:hypothetical protein